MIQMPRRSVTRFFIPLIDVMILLFCIFLLMPIFEEARKEEDEDRQAFASVALRRDLEVARLSKQLKDAQDKIALLRRVPTAQAWEELERLRKEKATALQDRFAIFEIGIDGKTGELFYYEPAAADTKNVLRSREQARKLIDRQNEEARGREVYFLFRLPRGENKFPTPKDINKINKDWFSSVRHGFDSPAGLP
jgi:hypothetical protein